MHLCLSSLKNGLSKSISQFLPIFLKHEGDFSPLPIPHPNLNRKLNDLFNCLLDGLTDLISYLNWGGVGVGVETNSLKTVGDDVTFFHLTCALGLKHLDNVGV